MAKLTKKQKRSKYNQSLSDKLEHNGHKFRSKLEVNHYKHFLDVDEIDVLDFEPFFMLLEPFEYYDLEQDKVRKYGKFSYKADFLLQIKGVNKLVVWESKGMAKSDYMIRKKMWYHIHGEDYYFIQSGSLKHCKKVIEDLLSRGD
jgi:hypothetical protein